MEKLIHDASLTRQMQVKVNDALHILGRMGVNTPQDVLLLDAKQILRNGISQQVLRSLSRHLQSSLANVHPF